jgi:hypothetical protein
MRKLRAFHAGVPSVTNYGHWITMNNIPLLLERFHFQGYARDV